MAAFREVARVLRPGAPLVVSFSSRCFPTKAIALWRASGPKARARYVEAAMAEAGLEDLETRELLPENGAGDPLWAVIGRAR